MGFVHSLFRWLHHNVAISIGMLTLIVLIFNPIPSCVDCEFPNAWGHNDAIVARDSTMLVAWFLGTSFLAGLLRWKKSWLIPVGLPLRISLHNIVAVLHGGR